MKHYGLDPEQGWVSWQFGAFPGTTKRRPAHITSLTLTLTQREQPAEAVQFTAAPGKTVEFAHPVTGVPCVLTVKDLKPARLPENDLLHMGPPHGMAPGICGNDLHPDPRRDHRLGAGERLRL